MKVGELVLLGPTVKVRVRNRRRDDANDHLYQIVHDARIILTRQQPYMVGRADHIGGGRNRVSFGKGTHVVEVIAPGVLQRPTS